MTSNPDNSPDFVAQNGEWAEMSVGGRCVWFESRMAEMEQQGAKWFQKAVDNEGRPTLALVEGWRERPHPQPEPRFQTISAETESQSQ